MRVPVLSGAVLSELLLARSGEWLHARVPASVPRAARRATLQRETCMAYSELDIRLCVDGTRLCKKVCNGKFYCACTPK